MRAGLLNENQTVSKTVGQQGKVYTLDEPCFKGNMRIRTCPFILPCKNGKTEAHYLTGDWDCVGKKRERPALHPSQILLQGKYKNRHSHPFQQKIEVVEATIAIVNKMD